jgi:hypothetical protein
MARVLYLYKVMLKKVFFFFHKTFWQLWIHFLKDFFFKKPILWRQTLYKVTHSVKAGIFIAIVAPATSQQRSAVGTLWA